MRPEELATHPTGPALSFLGALFIATSAFIFILIGRWMLVQVLAKVRLRGEAIAEVDDDGPVPGCECEDCDPVDAQLDSNPREPLRDESREPVHPLMREIYGALALARDGVDIEKGARREWAP